MPVVQPEAVRRLKIIANVNVRPAIIVDVSDLNGQAEVLRRRHGSSSFVAKCCFPVHRRKMGLAVVEVQDIRLTQFDQSIADELQPVSITADNDLLAVDHPHRNAAAAIPGERPDAEIGDIQIERPVAIHVAQRE